MTSARGLLKRSPAKHSATILFCDIRGFSSLFDERDPIEALTFANTVLSELGQVVEASGGYVDKFTGDGLLAHFGVVTPSTTHVADACWCVVRMRESLETLNQARHIADQPIINFGCGIHTGVVASGVITTSHKAEFTVLGDVVNLTARIESLTKAFAVDCLVSEAVHTACKDVFQFQQMGSREVKGVRASQLTYWLLPTNIFMEDQ